MAILSRGLMKPNYVFLVATTVFLAVLVFCMVAHKRSCAVTREGFADLPIEKRYANLKQLIKDRITPFCDLSAKCRAKLRDTLLKVQQASQQQEPLTKPPMPVGLPFTGKPTQTAPTVPDIKPDPVPPGDIDKQVDNVYLEGLKRLPINCSMFTLPEWSESKKDEIATILAAVPDTLPTLMAQEITFYSNAINKLLEAIGTMNNPPPDVNTKKEGFAGGICSPAAAQAKLLAMRKAQEEAETRRKSDEEARRQQALLAEAASCRIPDVSSQINRVAALLSRKEFAEITKTCLKLSKDVDYINEVEKKAMTQGLFSGDTTKKSYKSFSGGDRLQALIATLQSARP
jgi:hypothetical protein